MSVRRWPTLSAALFAIVLHVMLLGVAASLRVLRPRQPHALVTITLMQPAAPLPVAEGGGATPRIVPPPALPPNPLPIKPPQHKRPPSLKPPVTRSRVPPPPSTGVQHRSPPVLPKTMPPPPAREEVPPQEAPRLVTSPPPAPSQGAETASAASPDSGVQSGDLEKTAVSHNGDGGHAPATGPDASGSRGGGGGGGKRGPESGTNILAQPHYGVNPKPVYPLLARRMGAQGEVLLRVRVQPDGSVAAVELVRSSGFAVLDEAATRTVRDRWRFIPARREGVAIESWVEVPIKFVLAES